MQAARKTVGVSGIRTHALGFTTSELAVKAYF
jgi:hypothetical protein